MGDKYNAGHAPIVDISTLKLIPNICLFMEILIKTNNTIWILTLGVYQHYSPVMQ